MKKLSLLLLIVTLPLFAQKDTDHSQTESVLIGSGDEIKVDVLNTPELSGALRVSDSGEIRLETGNMVKVAGLSTFEAAQAIETSLVAAKMMNHPLVEVTISKPATQTVSVGGQVKTPGNYDLETPRRVMDVLTMAGGLGDLADRNITIIRKSTHERIKFYVQNSSEVETDKDVLVYPGDHVVVPKVGLIYVLGDVGRPGAYPMDTNDSSITALQAVALAGGINNTAAASKSVMMRKGANGYQESKLPLKDMEKGKVPNIALAADDIIFVPFSFGRNLAVNGAGIVATAGQAAIMHP
jgi:polysaccharide export outer membrane protein